MEEIDLKELLEFVKSKLNLLIFITIGVCLLGCIYGLLLQKPMYQSYTTVILGGNESSNNTISQSDITLNKNLVNTYAEIVKSKRVLNQVIDELSLDISYEGLVNMISVSAVNNTEIIKINVSDENAIKAKNIANVTANFFSEEVAKLYNINNVNILDEATEAKNPYNIISQGEIGKILSNSPYERRMIFESAAGVLKYKKRKEEAVRKLDKTHNINVIKQVIIYFLIGFVLAAGIIFVIFYFDRTIKSVEQVEQKIKLPILGSVQENERGSKRKWKKN